MPAHAGFEDRVRIEPAFPNQAARQGQGHLGIVGRLSGEGIERAAVCQVANAVRKRSPYGCGALKFNARPDGVAGQLAEEAALRPRENPGVAESST